MSLSAIDEYVRQLEAIKFYEQVKRQYEEGLVRIKELESKLKDAKNQINELEELRVSSDGRTLGETQKLVLKAKEEEVERHADAKFGAMKHGWEKDEKWNLVRTETASTLSAILSRLRGFGSPYPAGLEESGIPKLVKEIIDQEVNRRTDAIFYERVKTRADQLADRKLDHLKGVEWPNYLQSRVLEMETRIRENVVGFLAGPWEVTCNSCGMVTKWTFDPSQVSNLLRGNELVLECPNTACTTTFNLPYRFRVKLSELIAVRLGQNQ